MATEGMMMCIMADTQGTTTGGAMRNMRVCICVAAVFVAVLAMQVTSAAQNAPQAPAGSRGGQNHAAVESNPSCQRILNECRRLGFVQGQWKRDDGLWKDCFDPVLKAELLPSMASLSKFPSAPVILRRAARPGMGGRTADPTAYLQPADSFL